ncbi:hypothetical protein P154DRAFT_575683 [Amniculicola lignicola CBS 123094]|uniref:Uncharacterized protein n=1 Tax=Amniculicola lignicola CBS 123094 TaxID=1392246 RepID=A0A6A5WJK2_9PLEO|nr:hypothetical protein P154DRAFT_575683 [Amniculicola lignicola CBS 123094]
MRIAVAGTCGLARAIAREIQEGTSHQLLVLSRSHQPGLLSQGYQCQVVDYNDPTSIQHSLMGVDTVISTVTGNAQLRLIEAAVACRVRRFVPAEFEGQPGLRSANDPLDRGKSAALGMLLHYGAYIKSTVFVCGILYERFLPNGMISQRIGVNTGYANEGDYIVDARNMMATAPVYDAGGNLSYLCLTSAYDVARFVVKALDMAHWPAEMSMCGERISVRALVDTIQTCRGKVYNYLAWQNVEGLNYELRMAQHTNDVPRAKKITTLVATAEGKYDFATPAYLNLQFPDIRPIRFQDWFLSNWASVP